VFYYHPDHLGSSSYITDANGEVSQHVEYFAFGETFLEEHSNTDSTPYLFNGKELDEETGLYYYGARYYDAKTSVWQSVDPLAEKTMQPYSAFNNNPIRFIDPDGRMAVDALDDPIHNKRGKLIGDDGKTDGKAYIVQGSVARDVKKATKAGKFYTGSLTESNNVMNVPTGGVMDDVISSVDATLTSEKEHGGHANFGDANATRWDEGPAAIAFTDKDGNKGAEASLTMFKIGGKNQMPSDASNVEFWWHTHPKTEVNGIQLGSSTPSKADFRGQTTMQKLGFKGNTFVIGTRSNTVTFFNKSKSLMTIKYSTFKKIGGK